MDFVPALKGKMGDWEYYVTIMKLEDVSRRIRFAHELHPHQELDKIIQRELSNRVKFMVSYLLRQRERFYGSLIVAVYGGNPRFEPVVMAEHPILNDPSYPFGVVVFDGSQRYFALDGQHRLSSIQEAVEKDPDLGNEEISVIFVPHYSTDMGLRRTRRLFNTLNRYAKKTAKHVDISMDEDDAIAIVTRELLREHPLFCDTRVKIKGNTIPKKAKEAFTTLSTLYDANEALLTKPGRHLDRKYKQIRPPEDEIEGLQEEVVQIWNSALDHFPQLKEVAEGKRDPIEFREPVGKEEDGQLLFRPIGQIAFATAVRRALDSGLDIEETMSRLCKVDWRLGKAPWRNVVWEPSTDPGETGGRMKALKETRVVVENLICYLIGLKTDTGQLLSDYRRELGDENAGLPKKVHTS